MKLKKLVLLALSLFSINASAQSICEPPPIYQVRRTGFAECTVDDTGQYVCVTNDYMVFYHPVTNYCRKVEWQMYIAIFDSLGGLTDWEFWHQGNNTTVFVPFTTPDGVTYPPGTRFKWYPLPYRDDWDQAYWFLPYAIRRR